MGFLDRILWLTGGMALLWAMAASKWFDSLIYRATSWALRRWTHLDLRDYPALLQVGSGYSVCEFLAEPDDWVTGRTLMDLRLPDEGVQVLGIRRDDGTYIGAPAAATYIRRDDLLLLYGRTEHIAELSRRKADTSGEAAHEQRVKERRRLLDELERQQRPNRARETG